MDLTDIAEIGVPGRKPRGATGMEKRRQIGRAPAPFAAAAVQDTLDQPFGVEKAERRLLGAKPAPETAAVEQSSEMLALGRLALGLEIKDFIQRERGEPLCA